jgi:hypothetical protein
MNHRALAPFLALILVLITGCAITNGQTESISSNTYAEPVTDESEILQVTFVYDISLSARTWTAGQITSTIKWVQKYLDKDISISVETIDAFGGSQNCGKPTETFIDGDGANNPVTQGKEKEKKLQVFKTQLANWLTCERQYTDGKSGSDINFSSFIGVKNLIIFSDGLLRMSRISDELVLSASTLSDQDAIARFKEYLLNNDDSSLEGANVWVYGLGYQKSFTSSVGQELENFWRDVLNKLGAANISLSPSPNII